MGLITKEHTTIIMDGSDPDVVRDIIDIIDTATGEAHGKSRKHTLDPKHPTMWVIHTKTNSIVYGVIRRIIDSYCPGLCIFDPPMN